MATQLTGLFDLVHCALGLAPTASPSCGSIPDPANLSFATPGGRYCNASLHCRYPPIVLLNGSMSGASSSSSARGCPMKYARIPASLQIMNALGISGCPYTRWAPLCVSRGQFAIGKAALRASGFSALAKLYAIASDLASVQVQQYVDYGTRGAWTPCGGLHPMELGSYSAYAYEALWPQVFHVPGEGCRTESRTSALRRRGSKAAYSWSTCGPFAWRDEHDGSLAAQNSSSSEA